MFTLSKLKNIARARIRICVRRGLRRLEFWLLGFMHLEAVLETKNMVS